MFAPSLRQAVEDDLPVVWLWALSEEDGVRGEGEDEAGVCVAGGHAGGASASADENRGVPGGLCRLQADCGAGVWVSRKGDCWDNAPKESFFGTLKCELGLHDLRPPREEAHRKVFEYIEVFYNRQRLHSSLGYRASVEFERHSTAKAA